MVPDDKISTSINFINIAQNEHDIACHRPVKSGQFLCHILYHPSFTNSYLHINIHVDIQNKVPNPPHPPNTQIAEHLEVHIDLCRPTQITLDVELGAVIKDVNNGFVNAVTSYKLTFTKVVTSYEFTFTKALGSVVAITQDYQEFSTFDMSQTVTHGLSATRSNEWMVF